MLEDCETAATPALEFKAERTGFGVVFHFGEPNTQPNLGEKLGENRQAIIDAMRNDPQITAATLELHSWR